MEEGILSMECDIHPDWHPSMFMHVCRCVGVQLLQRDG